MRRYIEGIRFGLVVQFIIGPMCLMVFHTSKDIGFLSTLPLIFIIALVDIFYITLSCMGVNQLLKGKKSFQYFQVLGSVFIIIFGMNTICNVFSIAIIPGFNISSNIQNLLLKGLLLALSNPITIIYWGSVLTTKLLDDPMSKKELLSFCTGLVSATILFESFVALIGSTLGIFLPPVISHILNIGIGILIIYFGFRQLMNKTHSL